MDTRMMTSAALAKAFCLRSSPLDTSHLLAPQPVSQLPPEIWRWSATDLSAAIRKREVSCREAIEATAARAEQINQRITAIVDSFFDEALEQADACDAVLAHGKDEGGPLLGVPVSVKDNTDQRAKRTVNGAFTDALAAEIHNPVVGNLHDAGAILFGRSNTPCLSARWECNNSVYGQTHNPWSRERTPGGSSGGGAAAVAAGIGALAQGNDVGGSIRYPAFCCGVSGLRPSMGRVPMYNATVPFRGYCNQLFNVEGLLARDVRDLANALPAITRGHTDDPWWVGRPERPVEPTGGRIGLIADNPDTPMHPVIAEQVRSVGRLLSSLGFEVEEVKPPSIRDAMDTWSSMVFGELRFGWDGFAAIADKKAIRASELFLAASREITAQDYLQGTSRVLDIRREWARFMSTYPILIAPTSCDPAFMLDFDLQSVEETRRQLFVQAYLVTINLLGLPSVAVPTGMMEARDAPNGLPLGVQVIGRMYQDELALSIAALVQQSGLGVRSPVDPV